MKYTMFLLKMLLACCLLLGMAGVVMAEGTKQTSLRTVNELNAVIAAAIVLVVWVIVYIKRHRDFK